ncbi:MAG: hypothetical protein U0232_26185 [Thermomicrobiales bacterium]
MSALCDEAQLRSERHGDGVEAEAERVVEGVGAGVAPGGDQHQFGRALRAGFVLDAADQGAADAVAVVVGVHLQLGEFGEG